MKVRREKISERMKFLQDLVPGCSKVKWVCSHLDSCHGCLFLLKSGLNKSNVFTGNRQGTDAR